MSNRSVVKASEVTGVDVKSVARENLGTVNDIVIDKVFGKVNYVVLDFGGFLGFGNKFFALPWHLFTYDPAEDCFIINIDKERLKNAPGFDKDNWPNFADTHFTSSIDDYYR
ncbi:PRC-barrel domain-containing protein [Legionella gresilensis]|uniref:PRC-barrel domain-containing protein n=1 Tax=Legionella gresilensis TaxID=91823 RepID=UPI001041B1A9|nr:PRC-barrel domain-containing protein [Legionella gresilensis]